MHEKMAEFFDTRLDEYDEHMLNNINSAKEIYPFTAEKLPLFDECSIIDLGCGTGIELEYYFNLNPTAKVTGIDISEGMLNALKKKFSDKEISLINGSYFDIPFESEKYDAAVSVESLHHFTKEEKIPLYIKLHNSLKNGGYFILTDYFSESDEEEAKFRQEFLQLKAENNLEDNEIYHFDTPLTVEHETDALVCAGFKKVIILNSWGATYTIKAYK